MLTKEKKVVRYKRIFSQLKGLLAKSPTFDARLATINAVLYHKMPQFFWIGFYFLHDSKLTVGPYQGPLACQELEYPLGVCWKSILNKSCTIVENVHEFAGHIACDSRSKSEIVIPILDENENIVGVLDVDSDRFNTFDEEDERGLNRILSLLYNERPES
jgi:GAF domain-containing protein